jgi:prevent-host-death family protein
MSVDYGLFISMKDNTFDTISISEFKATCLAVLERVRRTGRPLLITRRGEPIAEVVPPGAAAAGATWLGSKRATARIVGDIVSPVVEPGEWEAVGR